MSKPLILFLCIFISIAAINQSDAAPQNSTVPDSSMLPNIVTHPIATAENTLSIDNVFRSIEKLVLMIVGAIGTLVGELLVAISKIFSLIVPDILKIPGKILEGVGTSIANATTHINLRRKRDVNGNATSGTLVSEIEHGVVVVTKYLFSHVFNTAMAFISNPDSIFQILEKLTAVWNTLKPIWEIARKDIIPRVMEALLKIEKSNVISSNTKEKIEDIKEAYELLVLLGYMPRLPTT